MGGRLALLIGVDGYAFRPLTSAVNDAVAMYEALTQRHGELPPIFDAADVKLFTTPATSPNSELATLGNIMAALRALYDSDTPLDFLLVYFAGHGLTVSKDGRTRETLLLASDATGPDDGRNMIWLTELLHLFSERGPLQQLWVIDACRDMPYEKRPRAYEIEWNDQPVQTQRGQFALFAVAPGGTALSEAGGQGRLTGHLLKGLTGHGSASDYIPGRGHCVTAPSPHYYAERRVLEAIAGYDEWTRAVQAPQRYQNGPALDPLRFLPAPSPQPFFVSVVPPEAAPVVKIDLEVQQGLSVNGWPPNAPPRVYELRTSLRPGSTEGGWGKPDPELLVVDLREQREATISVPNRHATASAPLSVATTSAQGIAIAHTVSRELHQPTFGERCTNPSGDPSTNTRSDGASLATVLVHSVDRAAHVHLRRRNALDGADSAYRQPRFHRARPLGHLGADRRHTEQPAAGRSQSR